jgi:hypothetical protein
MFAQAIGRSRSTVAATVVTALTSGLVPSLGHAGSYIRIGASVDGRDRLIIQGETLQWHHFDFAAVGRAGGGNIPTIIEAPGGAGAWVPTWPLPPPNEIRFEAFSSVFHGLSPALPAEPSHWHATKWFGRGEVRIVEQPSAANTFKLIVEFDDDEPLGGTFYLVDLSPSQQVVVDIKPFSRNNAIDLDPAGVITVAVLSNLLPRGFDATQLVPGSVTFGQMAAPFSLSASPISYTLTDVNHDGHKDVVFTFNVSDTGIHCGDAEAVLTGTTVSGVAIEGRDVVRTPRCQ